MSLRILGGQAKGRELRVPESARPTGARLRKSLFDLLFARAPAEQFPKFLDLHGGSGAIGLEAASRGYAVTLVEKDNRAFKALEANARALELRAKVLRGDSEALLPTLGQFDVVYSDPPYDADIPKLTHKLLRSGVVAPGGLLIAQHSDQLDLPQEEGYTLEAREYGSNTLSIYWKDEEEGD